MHFDRDRPQNLSSTEFLAEAYGLQDTAGMGAGALHGVVPFGEGVGAMSLLWLGKSTALTRPLPPSMKLRSSLRYTTTRSPFTTFGPSCSSAAWLSTTVLWS